MSNVTIQEGPRFVAEVVAPGRFAVVATGITILDGGGDGGVTDHGALTGLSDDDHTQYHNNLRGDARYSQLGHTHDAATITGNKTSSFISDFAAAARSVILTGISFVTGTDVTASDSILSAFGKLQAKWTDLFDSGTGKIKTSHLPDSILGQVSYQGGWNAATNTPTIPAAAIGNKGHYYVTNTAGSLFSIDFNVGDWIVSNGSAWEKVDNTDAVATVFGRTGPISAASGDYNADQINETLSRVFISPTQKSELHTHANKSILDSIQEALTTTLKTAYDSAVTWITTNGTNLINHLSNTSNPHSVTKSQVGLGNVDNTSDADKTSNNLSDIASAAGLAVLGGNVLFSPLLVTTGNALADAAIRGDLVFIEKNGTINGVWFYLQTSGVFTGDQVNSIALYSISAGIGTKIAETANDPSIWTGTANSWKYVAFAAPVAVTKGDYYVTFLYNVSAATTAPGLGGGPALFNAAVSNLFPNSVRTSFTLGAQSTQPATLTLSSTLATTQTRAVIVV
jgi:hypothetical protein